MRISDWSSDVCSSDLGWAGIAWPKELGGRGLSVLEQIVWFEEYARAGAPSPLNASFVMLNHAGPTLMACGTDEQKAYHLPKILNGDVLWCQGFSEPGPGSDLGSLKCRGEVAGDEIVINGTKIWRAEESPVGKKCVSTCRTRWAPQPKKK